MGTLIMIVGAPGTGKTMGMRNLDPEETMYINCDSKALSFKGRSKYVIGKNMFVPKPEDGLAQIVELISRINKGTVFKHVIIDTLNSLMIDKEMFHRGTMSFNEWYDLAKYSYQLLKPIEVSTRNDLFIFALFHEGVDELNVRRILSNGRKLEKIQLEGLSNNVFFTEVTYGDPNVYELIVAPNAYCRSKSYEGLFEMKKIPNDFKIIVDALKNYD